jgi:hypothetical protein
MGSKDSRILPSTKSIIARPDRLFSFFLIAPNSCTLWLLGY